MAKYHLKALTEKGKDGKMIAIASEETVDRQGDVVTVDGWELKNFKKNPQLLWMHNTRERSLPVGKVENIRIAEHEGKRKMIFEPVFEEITEFGRTVKRFFEEGLLNAFSVGFDPIDFEPRGDGGFKFNKQELLEISAVTVPALQTALVIQRSKDLGLNEDIVQRIVNGDGPSEETDEVKGALPFHEGETEPESAGWNLDEELKKADIKELKNMAGWVDPDKKDDKSGYKLIHHRAGSGNKVVWRAVATAMADLLSNEDIGIPDEDRQKVYNHFKKHYAQYEKEVPEFRNADAKNNVTVSLDEETQKKIHKMQKTINTLIGEVRSLRKEATKKSTQVQMKPQDLEKLLTLAIKKASEKLRGGDK